MQRKCERLGSALPLNNDNQSHKCLISVFHEQVWDVNVSMFDKLLLLLIVILQV